MALRKWAAHLLTSFPGTARCLCEGRLCSAGMLLLPAAPTSSGRLSGRPAGGGGPSAGGWNHSLSSPVVSHGDLPQQSCCCRVPSLCQSLGHQASPPRDTPSPDPHNPSVVRLLETAPAAAGPVRSSASAELPGSPPCPGRWSTPSPAVPALPRWLPLAVCGSSRLAHTS